MRHILVAFLVVAIPATTLAVGVAGKDFPKTATVEGSELKLLGAGLREKWFFDVYALGAYSASGACKKGEIIEKDEMKYIRLEMLRSVDAEKMSSTIGDSFQKAMPKNASAELKAQRKTFMSYFTKEFSEGTKVEFIYTPGTGFVIKMNGKQLGEPLTGVEFMKVFWTIYFGSNTCCEDLQESIMKTCK